MSNPHLQQLERQVEDARAKLAHDLATLRSPNTYDQFAEELQSNITEAKDHFIEKAKAGVQSRIQELVEDLKAKAAANPTAALAIAAGLAWKLIQRPPITSVLVGAGLVSLLRTDTAERSGYRQDDYFSQAKHRLREQAGEFAEIVKEEAEAVGAAVKEKAADVADAAKAQLQQWSADAQAAGQRVVSAAADQAASVTSQVGDAIGEAGQSASTLAARAVSRASTARDEWSPGLQAAVQDQRARDNFLLGAASVAVLAAVCVAAQRRQTAR